MITRRTLCLLVLGLAPLSLSAQTAWPPPKPAKNDFAKWEKAVAAFEKSDKEAPPAKGSLLFVGSSTIVRWKSLAQDFAGIQVLNRGFGGNQIKDCTYYAERMIFPYEPKAIFMRAGGNDIHAGWPVAEVFEDFKAFVAKVRARLPNVPIYYIGLSASVSREREADAGNELNALIAAYCEKGTALTYIDTRKISLGPDGRPREDLFVADKLHFNEAGYKLLVEAVRPYVLKASK